MAARNIDAIRSVIEGKIDFEGRRISIQLMGELTLLVSDDGVVPETEIATERSAIVVERVGDEFAPSYSPSVVSIPAGNVSRILKILFQSYSARRQQNVNSSDEA